MKSKALVYLFTFVGMFLFGMSQRMDHGDMSYVIGFAGGLIVFRVVSTLDDKVTELEERIKDSGNPV